MFLVCYALRMRSCARSPPWMSMSRELRNLGSIWRATATTYSHRPCRDGRVCAGPLTSAQLNADLRYWLTRCQIFDGETMHGMRSGGSVEKYLTRESLHSVMQLAYWKSPTMAKYYMKEWQVLCASVAGADPPQGTSPLDYARMNKMVGFCVAFPDRK
jgi:hypothetical protein